MLNLQGALFMGTPVSPFEVVDDLVEEARAAAKIVLVDFHAEATSEKVALSRVLDGRVTAVFGTHTHVQTSDARVQPGGTAAITDAGMTGPHDSVIGVKAELAIGRMQTGMGVRLSRNRRRPDRGRAGRVRRRGPRAQLRGDSRAGAVSTTTSATSTRSRASSTQEGNSSKATRSK